MDATNTDPIARTANHAGDDDLSLDRAIQQALSVEPSAEFVARVRGALSTERRSRRGAQWWLLGVGALAAASVLMVVVTSPERRGHLTTSDVALAPNTPTQAIHGSGEAPLPLGSLQPELPAPSRTESRTDDERRESASARVRGSDPVVPGSREPQVLIAPEEQAGWRMLMAMISDPRAAPKLDGTEATLDALAIPEDMSTPALVIEPIAVTD